MTEDARADPRPACSIVAALAFAMGSLAAHDLKAAAVDCSVIPALQGPGLRRIEMTLPAPTGGASVYLLTDAGYGAMALEVMVDAGDRAHVLLPAPAGEAGSQVTSTLLAIHDDDTLEWVCDGIETRLLPLLPDPGATGRFAAHLDDMAGQFWPGMALTPQQGKLVAVSDMFAEMSSEMTDLAEGLSPEGLAQTDAFLGAYLGALQAADPPTPAPAAPASGALARFAAAPATPAAPSALGSVHKALLDACPAGPLELTEYIHLGMKARAHSGALAQFYLTTGLTLAGVSARLVNKAYFNNQKVDKVIDKAVSTVNTTQALIGDYLAGMMPLHLETLELVHTDADLFDDTPVEDRQVRVTEARLLTRSDGWSMDKLALDALLGVVALKGSSASSGLASDATTAQARQNATRLERIAQTVERQFGTDPAVTNSVLQTVRQNADSASLKVVEMELAAVGVETVKGTVEGQVTGQVTGAVGAADGGLLGKKVSRCMVDLAKPEDGSRPRHLFLSIDGGDHSVAIPALEPALALDIVGTGRATAVARLNPSPDAFPAALSTSLPEARFDLSVAHLKIRIDGPGPQVRAGSVVQFSASMEGVSEDPRLIWSVSPVMLIEESGPRSEQVRLSVPDDLPEDTVITLTATAMGSFISETETLPQHTIVLIVKDDDEEEEPQQDEGRMTCGQVMDELVRPRSLTSGKPLAGRWSRVSSGNLDWSPRRGDCHPPSPNLALFGNIHVIEPDPDGLSVKNGSGGRAALGRIERGTFAAHLRRHGFNGFWGYPEHPPLNSCFAPPGFTNLQSWLDSPETEVFQLEDSSDVGCRGYVITDGMNLMYIGDLTITWHAVLYVRE